MSTISNPPEQRSPPDDVPAAYAKPLCSLTAMS